MTPDLMGQLRGAGATAAPRVASQPGRMDKADYALMALGVMLTLFVSLQLGYRRIFWEDEMLGWMLLRDPSWRHMIAAWEMGADGGGFAFYLTGRFWFWIFGASEISFRMYSATAFAAAFGVLWATLRRFYRRRAVAFAAFNTWFFCQTLVTHLAEGRFYGLLMLSTTVAIWLVVDTDKRTRVPPSVYLAFFGAHLLLVTSHLLGVLYSATILVALLALDWSRSRPRPLLYFAVLVSWLSLLPECAAIVASEQVGKPHFWTTPPNLSRWIGAYSAYSAEIALALLVLALTASFSIGRSAGAWREAIRAGWAERRPAYIVAAALLFVPVVLFVEGLFGPSLFINRYLLPVAIAQAILTAEAIHLTDWDRLAGSLRNRTWLLRSVTSLFFVALLAWDLGHLSRAVMPRRNYTDELTSRIPKGTPVLCEDAWAFTELIGRQHASGVRYTYLLDWPQSTSQSAPRLEVTQYHLMENWKKAGYFSSSIEYRDTFLRNNSRFLIFHQQPGPNASGPAFIGNPLLERLEADPAYQVVPYGPLGKSGPSDLWLVCRGGCSSFQEGSSSANRTTSERLP